MNSLLTKLQNASMLYSLKNFSSLTSSSSLDGRVIDVVPVLKRLKREHKKIEGINVDFIKSNRTHKAAVKKFNKYQELQRLFATAISEAHMELTMMLSIDIFKSAYSALELNYVKPFSHLISESSFKKETKKYLYMFNTLRNIISHSNLYHVFGAMDQEDFDEIEVLMHELEDIMFSFKYDNSDFLNMIKHECDAASI